ncbi:MAG: hypothetical protein LAN61_15080 [Acidobacteriia bacterium]|nr:hypothetical protein [Terriglobia bacterium]
MQSDATQARPLRRKQLRRLHALWHRWTGRLRLSHEADRDLRHYCIERFTAGRARETRELTESDADCVIQWLMKLVHHAEMRLDQAAGTAGRHGYPKSGRVPPNAAAWRALWGCAAALGMNRMELEKFVQRHYSGVGLRGLDNVRTMADLNRILWGLKAMLRRRSDKEPSLRTQMLAA